MMLDDAEEIDRGVGRLDRQRSGRRGARDGRLHGAVASGRRHGLPRGCRQLQRHAGHDLR